MSNPTWAEAATATTSDTVRDTVLLPACAEQGCDVDGWTPIAPQRALVEGNARALAQESSFRATMALTKSPATCIQAGSDWVDARLAWFNLPDGTGGVGRIKAVKARWKLVILCTVAAAPITIDASSVIVVQASDGTYFESTQLTPIVLNAASNYGNDRTIDFVARDAGTVGNVTANTITKVVTGPAGISIRQGSGYPLLVTAGRNAETDAAYVQRGLAEWARIGAAWTRTAFDYFIPLLATSVTRWVVDDSNPYGPGSVGVTLATATGGASEPDRVAVENGLGAANVRALGSGPLVVNSSTSQSLNITATLRGDGSNASLYDNAHDAFTGTAYGLEGVLPLGPVTLTVDLVRAILMGATYQTTVTMPSTAGPSVPVALNLPGFSGVEEIVSCSLEADFNLLATRFVDITIAIAIV